ncbi:9079_t:CDS:1, partial [Funneliformis geosporum]
MGALDEKIDNYYSEYKKLVKRLERDVRTVESELKVRDDCVDRESVIDLIQEIVPLL